MSRSSRPLRCSGGGLRWGLGAGRDAIPEFDGTPPIRHGCALRSSAAHVLASAVIAATANAYIPEQTGSPAATGHGRIRRERWDGRPEAEERECR